VAAKTDLLLSTEIAGLPRAESDALRDVYALDHERLILHLDRMSLSTVGSWRGQALPTGVPGVGRVAAQLSAFWFDQTQNIVPSHFLTDDPEAIRRRLAALGASADVRALAGRAQLVNRTRPLPVLCHVIGALFDADWAEYRATGALGGRTLPAGLDEGASLPEPLRIPRSAADGAPVDVHSLEHALEPGHARQIEASAREVFAFASALARENGSLLLARARFEYGLFDGTVVLIGCPLTPETASFRETGSAGTGGVALDPAREPLEAHLRRIDWQDGAQLPELPPEVVSATTVGYRALFERLTGQDLV
jgi:phosphoribosylaminoimidazole-succinocarboxamide synthase